MQLSCSVQNNLLLPSFTSNMEKFLQFVNGFENRVGLLWDYGISEALDSVHPIGNPISHSTHSGFRRPPATTSRLTHPVPWRSPFALLFCAFGVGYIFAAWISFMAWRFFPVNSFPFKSPHVASNFVGVGKRETFCDKSTERVEVISFLGCMSRPFASIAVGVGHDENPVSSVRGIDAASWNNKRPDGVADGFQVRKHRVESQVDDPNNILSNNPRGPEFFNNA